ncbi:MAG: hypothetical protein HOV71_18915 [Hamadaea sp.]|uniref:hypothetical protein n=1 Tax=Hamadaea sp. NPDC050747 TaxID=3155789 RepID=UPI0018289F1E|nr:hypothetical protein [Hamadaea sp.]NUR50202.1 hypothetical protein [Hamadaea sp.]NUT03026.1 hypothetical protein [Hamadaea sp.]
MIDRRLGEPDRPDAEDLLDLALEPDFASEHNHVSVADHDFGPEGRPDNETPHGYGGPDWNYHHRLVV